MIVVLSIAIAGALCCTQPELFPTAKQRLTRQILVPLAERRPEVLPLVRRYLEQFPDESFGVALAAEAAATQSEHQRAIELFSRLPADGGRWEFMAKLGLARRYEMLGRMSDAERHLRRAIELNPDHLEANNRLGNLLQISGRTWESAPYFFRLIRRGKCRGDELLGVATTERFFRTDDRIERVGLANDPPEPLVKLGIARRFLYANRQDEAEALLREVIETRPELGEAQGRLGRIIVERGNPTEFLHWRGSLPDEARSHPEVWFVQGLQARRQGQMEGAIRCLLEALELSPNHLGANVQIAGCLNQVGRVEIASQFGRRAELLAELEGTLNLLRADADPALMDKAISAFSGMGRFWEAAGWAHVKTRMEIPQEGLRSNMRHWLSLASREPAATAATFLPTTQLRRDDFQPPHWKAPELLEPHSKPNTGGIALHIPWNFSDEAEQAGIQFTYCEGTNEANRLSHIFNVMGGGLAAVDYDRDGWTDIYLAQANNWREAAPSTEHVDQLFRNLLGERFQDATDLAGVGDVSFSHGVTVGDFDQDGFPDIYIGNKGPNRLYHNNGDGTFNDVTDTAGVAGQEWTTSSVFADFTGDGLPDLYVANYTLLEETTHKECKRANGEPMACTPDVLTAEHDRCYTNLGDGTFRDVSQAAGIRVPDGKGLGVIAWDFEGEGRLGLFVANDTTPNFLFLNRGTDSDGTPRFVEEGVVRGVAFDVDGNAKASMGVAAADATGDGRIDMFITTFFGESNTLYSQRPDGFFDDLTRPFNLRDSGFWLLGFGCQFVDLDGDGWDDLIATNGHVDQSSSRGDPDRMPPQVFRNSEGKRFDEVSRAGLGPFFQGNYLGRGLATLDWNGDGKVDTAISHLHAPFALITNHTPSPDRQLVVRLAGRRGCLDPTGAIVRMRSGAREQTRFQIAGDGFLVTNERRLAFSISGNAQVDELEVRWPTGATQRWTDVQPGQDVLLIEGRELPVILRRFEDAVPNHPR
ncbi:MAG: VCBS repeat-containing protein [Planctomycetaceae bacterium]|nr:VCBS repeat-containing protein [Planctomycetaceae bacterium]